MLHRSISLCTCFAGWYFYFACITNLSAILNSCHFQLKCGHVFHLHCCKAVILKRWAGPRITFSFSQCPICKVCGNFSSCIYYWFRSFSHIVMMPTFIRSSCSTLHYYAQLPIVLFTLLIHSLLDFYLLYLIFLFSITSCTTMCWDILNSTARYILKF